MVDPQSTGRVRIHHSPYEISTQSSHFVDRSGWQAKMASIEFWIPWHNAHRSSDISMLLFGMRINRSRETVTYKIIRSIPWIAWFLTYCLFFCADTKNMSKFLNRILGVTVKLQNQLFQYFTSTLAEVIAEAKRNGRYDEGILGKSWLMMWVENPLHDVMLHGSGFFVLVWVLLSGENSLR